jgi:hypothetical protein
LDAATRQLDQMIDQARYKHNQHRNKFKEAIDYLDHIFEDFQREADLRPPATIKEQQQQQQQQPQHAAQQQVAQQQVVQQPSNNKFPLQQKSSSAVISAPAHALQPQQPALEPVQATFRPGNVKSAKEAFEKVAAAIASEKSGGGAGAGGPTTAAKLKWEFYV